MADRKPGRTFYASAEAAALAMPPMTDEAVAIVARILAAVEKRRTQREPGPAMAGPQAA